MTAPQTRGRVKAVAATAHAYAPLPMTPLRPKRAARPAPKHAIRRKPKKKRGFYSAVRRFLFDLTMIGGVSAAVLFISLDRYAPAQTHAELTSRPAVPAAASPHWLVDFDGDGVPDLANPTLNAVRGVDAYGSGAFHAERDGGHRRHEGADFVAAPGAEVHAPVSGVVSKIGYAYGRDKSLRFIELDDRSLHLVARIFYVDSPLKIGDAVTAGDVIGLAENLALKYPFGITNHVHVEISDGHGFIFDPEKVLPPTGAEPIFAALKLDPRMASLGPLIASYAPIAPRG